MSGVPRLDAALSRNSSSSSQDVRAQGYFFTGGIDYDSRLILDGLIRRDASSLFGPGEQWHTYYRASAAYRMAQESWWPFKRINEFKLRGSQGTAGTRPDFADQYETYTISTNGTLAKSVLGNPTSSPDGEGPSSASTSSSRTDTAPALASSRRTTMSCRDSVAGRRRVHVAVANAGTVVGTSPGRAQAQIFRRGSTSGLGVTADRTRHPHAEFNRSAFAATARIAASAKI
jgi:hypothetical protein